MARARDVAFIRKLCALGLPAQTLAQSLLPALRGVISAHSAGVFWVDATGEMTGLYAERLLPPEAMARYYEHYYLKDQAVFAESFRRRAADPDPVSIRRFSAAEQRSEYFRDVMEPLDAYQILYGIVKLEGRPVAQLSFYRGRDEPSFDRDDADQLRSLLRYAAAGLARPPDARVMDDPTVVVEEQLGIVSPEGAFVSAPEPWVRLLRLAALSAVSPRDAAHERLLIADFASTRCAAFLTRQRMLAQHSETLHTPWGRFSIRLFRLPQSDGRDAAGMLLRREEPRMLALVRGTGVSSLSPQQREVAILLAQGASNRDIAETLGLSLNTAAYHVKQVFARLGVKSRGAVADALLVSAQQSVDGNSTAPRRLPAARRSGQNVLRTR